MEGEGVTYDSSGVIISRGDGLPLEPPGAVVEAGGEGGGGRGEEGVMRGVCV